MADICDVINKMIDETYRISNVLKRDDADHADHADHVCYFFYYADKYTWAIRGNYGIDEYGDYGYESIFLTLYLDKEIDLQTLAYDYDSLESVRALHYYSADYYKDKFRKLINIVEYEYDNRDRLIAEADADRIFDEIIDMDKEFDDY